MPKKSNLYLVGTVHTDPDGISRLNHLLARLAPKKIFLEISEDRTNKILATSLEDKMKKHEETLEQWTQQGFILTPEQKSKLVDLIYFKNGSSGFEVSSSFEYKKTNPLTEIYYVDIVGEGIVEGMDEALERSQEPTLEVRKNVLRGLEYPLENHKADLRKLVELQYKQYHEVASYAYKISCDLDFFERELAELSVQAKESLRRVFDPKRDEFIAKGIRKNYCAEKVSLAIMGASHLDTVAYLLTDLYPSSLLLNETSTFLNN